ncbi:MAG: PAS domain-containing sensor histidine kinase [Sphingobacteriales bacterium]|nr:MAG: PAS domain-containing sensor histidine kinase [Sphingobacteriales bacterium]
MNINCNQLLESIRDGILMLDRDGYISYLNNSVTEITGFIPEDILNKPLSVIYALKEDGVKAEYELGIAAKNGRFTVEGWKARKDGSHFWALFDLFSVLGPDGDVTGFSCTIKDISKKKSGEIALRENEERYRLMVEAVRDYSILLLDPEGYVVTSNEGTRRIKGYSPSELAGKHFTIFYTSADLEAGKPERELIVCQAEGKYEEEGWRVKKNGSLFWANIVLTALYNERNKLVGYSKVTRDLTERKYEEESLRQSEERYRSLVEQVTDYGIFMMDEKGRIISWNEGAKRIKGYTAQEIIGKYFSIFYPEEDILNGKPAMELTVARKVGKYEEEGWRIRKDGSLFWANVVITAVYNPEGALIGFSKVTRDLTERKNSEKALRDSYEKYRQLTEELKSTNSELSYANEELEQFTSIVSHDLQEPIRTIKSFLQLIDLKLSKTENNELKTYIDKSINAANRMRELIRNLLHYSQLSKGELIEEDVNVNELIHQAIQNLRTSLEISKAEITIENELKTVKGDKVQLLQLVQNLLSNAIKFTDDVNPRIVVRTGFEKGKVKFSVSDNGIGIGKEDLNKVFEIFRRLDTQKEYPGTGIGLAICKKIVDRHGGAIWPESEKGKGTTFHFTLSEQPQSNQEANEKV